MLVAPLELETLGNLARRQLGKKPNQLQRSAGIGGTSMARARRPRRMSTHGQKSLTIGQMQGAVEGLRAVGKSPLAPPVLQVLQLLQQLQLLRQLQQVQSPHQIYIHQLFLLQKVKLPLMVCFVSVAAGT